MTLSISSQSIAQRHSSSAGLPTLRGEGGHVAEEEKGETHELWIWPAQEFLKANEELKSHLDADVIALGQLIASGSKAAKQVRLLGVFGRAYISKSAQGIEYIVFKGNPRLRPNLAGTRYALRNPKIACFVVGTRDIVEDAAKGTKLAIFAFVAIDIIKELNEDHFSLASLGVRILSDVLQAVAAAAIGAAAGVVLTTIGAPTVFAFVVVVGVGFVAGMIIADLDGKYKLTERARARMMVYENQVGEGVSALGQGVRSAEQRIEQVVETAGAVIRTGYQIDRLWQTIEEMRNFDLRFSLW